MNHRQVAELVDREVVLATDEVVYTRWCRFSMYEFEVLYGGYSSDRIRNKFVEVEPGCLVNPRLVTSYEYHKKGIIYNTPVGTAVGRDYTLSNMRKSQVFTATCANTN
jgi:hypothetical protein